MITVKVRQLYPNAIASRARASLVMLLDLFQHLIGTE